MKKFYNSLLIIISLAIITVVALIIVKYGNNYKNEKEIEVAVEIIEEKVKPIQGISDDQFFDDFFDDGE